MFSREKYCAVCGCFFSLPPLRDPDNPEPDEDAMMDQYADAYDKRKLSRQMTRWLTDFRVVGRWHTINPALQNDAKIASFFVSGPAKWSYKWGPGEPEVPTSDGKLEQSLVYELADENEGMLFPIHQACLEMLDQLCDARHSLAKEAKPSNLEDFCDLLRDRRRANDKDFFRRQEDHYYGRSGGPEWDHKYYGARQAWADEWDAQPGWELLCADPSEDATTFILDFDDSDFSSSGQQVHSFDSAIDLRSQMPWLSTREADAVLSTVKDNPNAAQRIGHLNTLSSEITLNDTEGEEGPTGGALASKAPLGLKNRWRIWKILESI